MFTKRSITADLLFEGDTFDYKGQTYVVEEYTYFGDGRVMIGRENGSVMILLEDDRVVVHE